MASDSEVDTDRICHFMKMDREALYLAVVCIECHKIPSEDVSMKVCSKCRMVSYCGKECQTKNWKYHKKFCKAVASLAMESPGSYLLETVKETAELGIDFQAYLKLLGNGICDKLDRMLDPLEAKILMTPKMCEICKDANHVVLKPCKICHMVFYCSENHSNQDSEKHSKFCQDYLLCLQGYYLVQTKGLPNWCPPKDMPFRVPIVSEYKPLSGTMKDHIESSGDSVIDACLSDWISSPLSIMYALEHTGLNDGTKKIDEVKELTILNCDAFYSIFDTEDHCTTWEYILHFLPNLKKLNIIFCEPYNKCLEGDYISKDKDLCSDCITRKCTVNLTLIKDYNDFKGSEIYKKPDLIFYHEFTMINETERYLPYPEPEVPLVLFGADKSTMKKSLHIMRENESPIILLPLQLNPFRGMLPNKVLWDSMEDGSFLQYKNCYIVGLQRHVK